MKSVKVWFEDFFTEAHRQRNHGDALVAELAKFGIECQLEPTADCEFAFCGSIWKSAQMEAKLAEFPNMKLIHYNWDIYPFQVQRHPNEWLPYIESLKRCHEVWVPSQCTVRRTEEYTGRSAKVMKASIRTWEPVKKNTFPGCYVVDVMRKYPDVNQHACKEACDDLGIHCIELNHTYDWDEFRSAVAYSSLLVSAYEEASTGGLTLLEGYWHGVPVLCSNSPRNGAIDYFGRRASYFQWNDKHDLAHKIAGILACDFDPSDFIESRRKWIESEYSERAFAKRIAVRLRELSGV